MAIAGLGSLDGATQTLPRLYSLSPGDYHDVVNGNNGFAAHSGYDYVTGLGTPRANRVIQDLINVTITAAQKSGVKVLASPIPTTTKVAVQIQPSGAPAVSAETSTAEPFMPGDVPKSSPSLTVAIGSSEIQAGPHWNWPGELNSSAPSAPPHGNSGKNPLSVRAAPQRLDLDDSLAIDWAIDMGK
jgi:hypothetical protein